MALIDKLKSELGFKASQREVIEGDGSHALREPAEAYGLKFASENEALRSQNTMARWPRLFTAGDSLKEGQCNF